MLTLYGIVRDASGKPKFDDPASVPAEIKAALTDKDIMLLENEVVEVLGLTARKQAILKGN